MTEDETTVDLLTVGIRVWATRRKQKSTGGWEPPRTKRSAHHPPQRTLVFDTETTTDPSQRLNFGCARYFVDRHDGLRGTACVREFLFYADDLPTRDPHGYEVLCQFVKVQRAEVVPGRSPTIRLLSRAEFVEQVLYEIVYRKKAMVVGFNLPFDMTRIAVDATKSRKTFYGGTSLRLFDNEDFRPRFVYRPLDSKRSLMAFTRVAKGKKGNGVNFAGRFVDLRTLAFAFTDESHSLESACNAFEVPYTKRDVTHGAVTAEYVDYCRDDVRATATLLRATLRELALHPIDLAPERAYSPASIGKAYLKAMKIRPTLELHPDFDPGVLGHVFSAYFGGRAETRIRKLMAPVRVVDFTSMYPTVNALMNNWSLVTASKVEVHDATDDVSAFLDQPDLAEKMFEPATWPQLACFVSIVPDGDVVPVRAQYDATATTFGIGVNPFTSDEPVWYALADLVNSVLLTGRQPTVVRAFRLVASGRQRGLKVQGVRGTAMVDPKASDLFRRLIELRHLTRADDSISEEEKVRQVAFLKVLANATGYGIFAEMNPQERSEKRVKVVVYDDAESPFDSEVDTPENPGAYCFPPLAALITAAAHLMLGLLEHEVQNLGGTYVFCDTDSMGIAATPEGGEFEYADDSPDLSTEVGHEVGGELSGEVNGGRGGPLRSLHALSYPEVEKILDKFSLINPYDKNCVGGSILRFIEENYGEDGGHAPLFCYSLSAKRYALFRRDGVQEGPLTLDDVVKASEHGLGHLLDPLNPGDPRDPETSDEWMKHFWLHLVDRDRRRWKEASASEPSWLDFPALTRLSIPGPKVLAWFTELNRGRSYGERIKPANFLLMAHPDPLYPSDARPIAPYERDASKWLDLSWIDRLTGSSIKVTTRAFEGVAPPGEVRIRTFRDVMRDYEAHPEAKSLAPDGDTVRRGTRGLLLRRPVRAMKVRAYLGKEGNKLDERAMGLADDPDQYQVRYANETLTVFTDLVLPVLRMMNRTHLAMESEISRRQIIRIIKDGNMPRDDNVQILTNLAVSYAKGKLAELEVPVPKKSDAALTKFLEKSKR